MNAQTGPASAQLSRLDAQLKGVTATAAASSAKTGKSASRMGTMMASAGKQGALAAVVIAGASAKLALDFEDAMLKVENLVGIGEHQVDEWGDALLDLAPKVGKTPQELAEALYFVASSGIKVSKVLDTVEIAAQASAIGLGETQVVADALTSAMNGYSKSGLTARDATNVMLKTVKFGKLEADALAQTLGKVIPIASQLKVPFADVGAALATMSLSGLDAAESTTAFRGVLASFLKPTEDADKALKSVGLSAAGLRDMVGKPGGFNDVLRLLKERFHGNEEAMARVFPNVRALTGVFNVLGNQTEKVDRIQRKTGDSTDSLAKASERLAGSPSQKLRQAWAFIQAQLIRVGQVILDVAFQKIPRIVDALEQFWKQSGILRASLRFLWNYVKKVWAGIVQVMRGGAQTIKGIVQVISGVLTLRFGRAWAGVKNIFGGSIKIIIGMVAAMAAPLRQAAEAVGNALGVKFSGVWDRIKKIFEAGGNAVLDVVQAIADVINVIPGVPDINVPNLNISGGGGGGRSDPNPHRGRYATGGRIGGRGLQDTVPIMAAPGEAIVNRHQQPHVEKALATTKAMGMGRYGSLGELFGAVSTPHYAAGGGFMGTQHFGVGGVVEDVLGAGASVIGKGAGFFIDKLPTPDIPQPFKGLGPYLIAQVSDYIKSGFQSKKFGKFKELGGGVPGYSGPPANMKQLGDNAWVDSHTLAVAALLSKKFGISISSGWRSVAHNAAVGGVPGSLHTHGSAANPGAIDFVPPSGAALGWASSRIAGLEEAMIHDAGSGLHLHLGFFNRGGFAGAKKARDRKTPAEIASLIVDRPRTRGRGVSFDARGGFAKAQRFAKGGKVGPRGQARNLMEDVWKTAAPLYGRAPSSPMPRTVFNSDKFGITPSVHTGGWGGRVVDWSNTSAAKLAKGNNNPKLWVLHEWAHYFQKRLNRKPKWETEGGAQAFARWAAPNVYRKAHIPFRLPFSPQQDEYGQYAARVKREKGWPWIKHGQFFAKGGRIGTQRVTASTFDDPMGYRGPLRGDRHAYAELGKHGRIGNALGGLPYRYPIQIARAGKSVIARKKDIGLGGHGLKGTPRAVDIYKDTAQSLGIRNWRSFLGLVHIADVQKQAAQPAATASRKAGGAGFSGPITVKHAAASASQTHTAEASMKASDVTKANHKARVALIMAATQESNMSPRNTYQLTSDFGPVDPGSGTFAQAKYWLTNGYWGKGGGIALSKTVGDPGAIAQMVEGSAYPSAYSPWKSEAQSTVDAWRGRGGGGGADSGPTRAETKKAASKARKVKRVAEIAKLRKKVGAARTAPQKVSAYLDLFRDYAQWGEWSRRTPAKDEMHGGIGPGSVSQIDRFLTAVRNAVGTVSPTRAIRHLAPTAKRLSKDLDVTGHEPNEHSILERFEKVLKKAGVTQEKRTQTHMEKVSLAGLVPRVQARIKGTQGRVANLDELIQRQESLASSESGPAGSEMTVEELARQVSLNKNLYRNLLKERRQVWSVLKAISGKALAGSVVSTTGLSVGTKKDLRAAAQADKGHMKVIREKIAAATPPESKTHFELDALKKNLKNTVALVKNMGGLLKGLQGRTGKAGRIFETWLHLRDLGSTTIGADTESETAALLKQLLQEANLRTAVSQAQYGALKGFPPFGGSFAQGGVVPGPAGQPRTVVVHAGEAIGQPGDVSVIVHGDIVSSHRNPVEVVIGDKRFNAAVKKVTRDEARRGARVLPGRGGG